MLHPDLEQIEIKKPENLNPEKDSQKIKPKQLSKIQRGLLFTGQISSERNTIPPNSLRF
jgi:hypothetical protein